MLRYIAVNNVDTNTDICPHETYILVGEKDRKLEQWIKHKLG